jgi:hypothetical protein
MKDAMDLPRRVGADPVNRFDLSDGCDSNSRRSPELI